MASGYVRRSTSRDNLRADRPHFSTISLRNFRGFKASAEAGFAPLTFLVGPNSSGKSSLFGALLFLSQSDLLTLSSTQPVWSGPLVDLGSFTDTVLGHRTAKKIRISVGLRGIDGRVRSGRAEKRKILPPFRLEYTISHSERPDTFGRVERIVIQDSESGAAVTINVGARKLTTRIKRTSIATSTGPSPRYYWHAPLHKHLASVIKKLRLEGAPYSRMRELLMRLEEGFGLFGFARQMDRVSSGRAAPRRWYSAEVEARERTVTNRVFNSVTPSIIRNPAEDYDLDSTTSAEKWRAEIGKRLKDLRIADRIRIRNLSAYHIGIELHDHVTNIWSSFIDVGFGTSQAIPIIVACLERDRGPLFVEQPELHLHPRAQGDLAELLWRTSLKRQVVVETHSVHFINRARLAIARGELSPEDVLILYIDRDKDGSHITEIPILKNGEFGREWPSGFFEERYNDTVALLHYKDEK